MVNGLVTVDWPLLPPLISYKEKKINMITKCVEIETRKIKLNE